MSPTRAGHLAMFLFSFLVAGSFALGALVANDIAPMALNAVRFYIAAVVMGILVGLTSGFNKAAAQAPWRYFVLAVFFTTYFVLMFEGLKTTAPVSASALFTLTPIMTAGISFLLLGQVLTARMALALAIGACGAVWVIFDADWQAALRFEIGQGGVIYFFGCVAHAVYTPLVRCLNRGEPAVIFSFGVVVAGAVILTVLGWSDMRATDWGGLRPIVWVTILYTAIFASAATFTLLQFSALRLPSSKVMAYTYLTPSWVVLWDIALGGAVPPMRICVGIGLTIISLAMLLQNDPN